MDWPGPLVLSCAFGPEERLPAASRPVVCRGARDHQIGKQGTLLLAPQQLAGRGHQLSPRGDLGPVIDRDRHQLLGRLIARNQRDLQERRFHRLEQRVGLEQQDFSQASTRNSPVANGDLLGLPQALKLSLGAVDFQRGDQARRERLGEIDQQLGPGDRRPDAQQPPARRLKIEERLRNGEQDVVPSGLNIGPPRGDHAACRQRIEDRIGEPDEQARPSADKDRLTVFLEILAGEDVLLRTVVPEVIDAGVQGRNQECLGLELQGKRLPHLDRRRFDVQRPHARKLHRRRQVDRQPARGGRIHATGGYDCISGPRNRPRSVWHLLLERA